MLAMRLIIPYNNKSNKITCYKSYKNNNERPKLLNILQYVHDPTEMMTVMDQQPQAQDYGVDDDQQHQNQTQE